MGFGFKTPKWIRSRYKSLKLHKIHSQSMEPPIQHPLSIQHPNIFSGYVPGSAWEFNNGFLTKIKQIIVIYYYYEYKSIWSSNTVLYCIVNEDTIQYNTSFIPPLNHTSICNHPPLQESFISSSVNSYNSITHQMTQATFKLQSDCSKLLNVKSSKRWRIKRLIRPIASGSL